jgi:arabinogalactan oligomer/maltooligosaccharide transport system substrate-binding protein
MGQVWQFWGIAQASVINGEDPTSTWQKLAADVQGAIG